MLNSILNEVQDNLKAWLTTPVNDRLLNTICALHSCGVKLSHTELEALRDSLGSSYFGQKLMQKIAKDSRVMQSGNIKRQFHIIASVPFMGWERYPLSEKWNADKGRAGYRQ